MSRLFARTKGVLRIARKAVFWIVFVAVLIVVLALVLPLISDGNPNPIWVQTGSTLALCLITVWYALSTEKMAGEAKLQREAADKAIGTAKDQIRSSEKDAKKSRTLSVLPIVVLRSAEIPHEAIPRYGIIWAANVGSGPAINIEVRISAQKPAVLKLAVPNPEYHWRSCGSIQPFSLMKGLALGSGNGSLESGYVLIEQNMAISCIHLDEPGFTVVALYDDVCGNGYCTLSFGDTTTIRTIYHAPIQDVDRQEYRKTIFKESSAKGILEQIENCSSPVQ